MIVTGKPGSGTRLISRLLYHAGFNLGDEINHEGDSIPFIGPIFSLLDELVPITRNVKTVLQRRVTLMEDGQSMLSLIRNHCKNERHAIKLPDAAFLSRTFLDLGLKVVIMRRNPYDCAFQGWHFAPRYFDNVGYRPIDHSQEERDPHERFTSNMILTQLYERICDELDTLTRVQDGIMIINYYKFVNDHVETVRQLSDFINFKLSPLPDIRSDWANRCLPSDLESLTPAEIGEFERLFGTLNECNETFANMNNVRSAVCLT